MLAVRRLGTVTDGSVWRAVHTVRFQEGWRAKHDGARVDHPTKHDNARVDHVTSAAPTRTRTPNEIRNVAWSREEEAVLRELIGKKMDKRSIAEAVGRSHNAVVNRLWVLRRDGQELVRRRRWTPAEHHHMLDLYAVNFPPVLIAARLNRTIRSIYCRILKLRQTKTPFKPKFKSPAITPSDKETMLSLRDAGWTADRVCAEHFPQYTVSSVRHACNYYRSYRHTGTERSFHKWSEEEVKQLVELRREKVRWKVVAATLQCGIAACRAKYYRVMTSHAGVDDAKRGVSPSPALAGGEKEGKEEGEQKQKQKQRRGDEMAQLGVEGRKER
ncbi:uncharacterized protein RCC_00903 [Ramularia collo-cygni]|uniref:Myb-like domain-containing protein n=1 Tax=Ramularia collo-cygni TaxID=112498 RepID=A0A2D3UPS4_9PEZI|nr:uncharacterized protein RCC_00903 [Ramularia collo-cygni]CZT14985.1 uncharacterized protein RCC_00903 [Ramularia collo-cygni]